MKHDHEQNIKCPYCDYENTDSWEFNDEEGKTSCPDCGNDFNYERHIEVTYSTTRIACDEQNNNHQWQLKYYSKRVRKYHKGEWIDLPENEHTYFKISECSICGEDDYTEVSKEHYDLHSHETYPNNTQS